MMAPAPDPAAAPDPAPKYKHCEYCGTVISGCGGRRRYCTPAHKQAAYRERLIAAKFA